jgi:hypothetical protein
MLLSFFLSVQFRQVVEKDFVKDNLWPELIPQLKLVLQNSNLVAQGQHPAWNTINALKVLQAVLRPFQVYLILTASYIHDVLLTCLWKTISFSLILLKKYEHMNLTS